MYDDGRINAVSAGVGRSRSGEIALRSRLLIPPIGLMSAAEQSYLV